MKRTTQWVAVFLAPTIVLGGMRLLSRDVTVRNREWPTQMAYSPAYRSQTVNSVLPYGMTEQPPVPGTIPRGFKPFRYGPEPSESDRAGRELKNPFSAAPENLARGQYIFSNYCAVCHGATGAGDGPIIPKYPNPPSYLTERSKSLPDGTLFHIITLGRGHMPPHAAQVSTDDRWKVILYIRHLQGKVN